ARMQISPGSAYLNLGIDNAAQSIHQCGNLFGWHAGVTDKGGITLQTLGMRAHIFLNRLASSLLLTLDQDTHVHRQGTRNPHQGFQGFEDQHGLTLVIASSPAIEIIASQSWLERW